MKKLSHFRKIRAKDITDKLKPLSGLGNWLQSAFSMLVSTYMIFIMGCGIVHLVDLSIEYRSFWASLTVLTLFGLFAVLTQSFLKFASNTKTQSLVSKARMSAQVHFAAIFLLTYWVIYYLKTSNGAAC